MSDRVLLRDAVRALQTVEAEHDLAELTERRVLSTLERRARRGRAIRTSVYALGFSVCAAASAHAAVHGPSETWRMVAQLWLPAVPRESTPARPARAVKAPVAPVASRASAGREQAAQAVDPGSPSPQPAAPASVPAPAPRARRVVARAQDGAGRAGLVPESVPEPPVAPSPEALYDEAHQLHFMLGDKYAALRAWDAYLAAAPDGTFAPEAHYNRALCLVALGRNEVALTALRAIAAGERASYRARDAARLVRALEARSSRAP